MPFNSFDNYPMSWRPILKASGKPLYIELAEQLQSDIQSGVLAPGTKLPPQRELADFLDINVSTVSRAFKICSSKGLLTGTVGSGTYVAYSVLTNLAASSDTSRPMIELGSMMPETIPQDESVRLLREMLDEPDCGKYFQYSHGIPEWQLDAASRLLKRVGVSIPNQQILIAGGGQNAIASIFSSLLSPGDRIGVDPLVYPGVKNLAVQFGIQLVPIEQKEHEIQEDSLLYAIKNYGIKALYLVPDFQNPTCHTMSEEARKMLARLARKYDLLIIEDGITALLNDSPLCSIQSNAPENTIYILSVSKTVSPALRLAYMAVPEKYYSALNGSLNNINLSQSSLLMELSSRLIVSGQIDDLLSRRSIGIAERNKVADEVLSGFQLYGNSRCLARWLVLPNGMSGAEFEHAALEKGVIVYGSERFTVGKDCPERAARLAVCTPDSIEELRRGLEILRSILE